MKDRPAHEIDSMGYQVEYRNLYSEAQVKELLAERDAVLRQALNALHWTTPIGSKPVKQTQDAMDAIRKVLA